MNRELTQKEIVEKDFKTTMRGYNQTEVDEFLDVVSVIMNLSKAKSVS